MKCQTKERERRRAGSRSPHASALTLVIASFVFVAAMVVPSSAMAAKAATRAPAVLVGGDIRNIKHVIVIMQENRSFDSYFGTYPGADGIAMTNGVPNVCLPKSSTGCVRPYHDANDVNATGPHGTDSAYADINGGAMDGFQRTADLAVMGCTTPTDPGCRPPGPTDVMGYHDATEIPNYWNYAQNYVLQDRMFQPDAGWSLPSHQFLVSGWAANCKSADPMSCTSSAWGGQLPPSNPTMKAPNYSWTDLTWLLHRNNVSWKYYVTNGNEANCRNPSAIVCAPTPQDSSTPSIWNPLPWFADVKADNELANITSTSNYYAAAAAGTLPAVSWIAPSFATSEHGPARVSDGQEYVTSLINAAMSGPDWNSTAIFVSWDDWGGLYDHVLPPTVDNLGYGLRVPGLVISPYAKKGYIDHQTLSFDAYIKFIEDDFLGGQRLDPLTDGRPDSRPGVRERAAPLGDLTADFDFTQVPRPPVLLTPRPWAAPQLTALSTATGPTAGANTITVTGTGFDVDPVAHVAGVNAATQVVNSSTLSVVLPPHAAGVVPITVSTRGGLTPTPLTYSYVAPVPQLSSIYPVSGNVAGTNTITVNGTGFTGATAVDFGGTPATSYSVRNDTQLTAVVPARPAGPASVHVTTAGGTTPVIAASTYTYDQAPMINSMSTHAGTTAGGTNIIIKGAGFTGTTSVKFNAGLTSAPAAGFTVNSDTQITATSPAHGAGLTVVSVTNAQGTSPLTNWVTWFTFVTPPTVASLSPSQGPTAGGTSVIIRGSGFTRTSSVRFNTFYTSVPAAFRVDSDTQITATTPIHGLGLTRVSVTNPVGTSPSTPADLFRFVPPPPTIVGIAPNYGSTVGGDTVTITGTDFSGATSVAFSGTPASTWRVVNATTITATAPAHAAGPVTVAVTTPGGSSPAAAAATFTFVAPGSGSFFHPLDPVRILDSRGLVGGWNAQLVAGSPRVLTVTGGAAGIPTGADSVILNVSVTGGSDNSFLTAYPAGAALPTASNVNFAAGQTISNLVTARVGTNGQVAFANEVGVVDLVVDVVGYFDSLAADRYNAISPTRILDSRTTVGGWNRQLVAASPKTLQVRGAPGVPATADAVIVNLTVTGGTADSFLTAYPGGAAAVPITSNINFAAGQTIATLATVKIGPNGTVAFANAAGSVDVVADVVGYFDPLTGDLFHALAPGRILDSRTANGGWSAQLFAAIPKSLTVWGSGGVVPGAKAVVANATVTGSTENSFLTVYPGSDAIPTASNLNFAAGQTIPNLVAVKLDAAGRVAFNNAAGATDVIFDVVGYFAAT